MYLAFDMGIHYVNFMRRNLENKKKMLLVRVTNNAGLNSMNIVNRVGIFYSYLRE